MQRFELRRELRGAHDSTARLALEDLTENRGQIGRLAVLHAIDEQPLADAARIAIQPLDPLGDFRQILRPRGDDQQGVEPLEAHELDHAGERALVLLAEHDLELVRKRFRVDEVRCEQGDRHAL